MISRTPQRIAAFGMNHRLCAVFSPMTYAAKALCVKTASVHDACMCKVVACQGFYLRKLLSTSVGVADLGKLTIEEYDRQNGIDTVIYPTRTMRKRRGSR